MSWQANKFNSRAIADAAQGSIGIIEITTIPRSRRQSYRCIHGWARHRIAETSDHATTTRICARSAGAVVT